MLTQRSGSPKLVLVSCLQSTRTKHRQSRGTPGEKSSLGVGDKLGRRHKARDPQKEERSSWLMLLKPARCFLEAGGPLCSQNHCRASLLKNYILPSSTLSSLCQHQDPAGDWDTARKWVQGDSSVLPHSKALQCCGHCSSATMASSSPAFRHPVCSAGQGEREHFQASLTSSTPSSGLNMEMPSSGQAKNDVGISHEIHGKSMRSMGDARISHD